MKARIVAVCILLSAGAASRADVRSDVDAIAQQVQDNYFDAKRGSVIAKELREHANAGRFDAFKESQDLAREVTTFLQPFDGHFRVMYEPQVSATDQRAAAPRLRFEDAVRRSNYGFRRIERLPGNIGLIELTQVAHIEFGNPNDPARRAADAALALVQGADAVIIDLRNNGGGAPSMVGYLVSAFVKSDANVYNVFHSREGTESERPEITYPYPNLEVPLFVLTGARTGSAAEAIAFTLQSCGRAQIVGERSGGAANPGELFRTPQGYTIFVSTGSPRNPLNGRNWEGDGVRPDVDVPAAAALDRASILALERAMQSTKLSAQETVDAQWVKEALSARAQPFKAKGLADFAGTYGQFTIEVVGDALRARWGRRPPVTLIALREDTFFDDQNPSRRFVFERVSGNVTALRVLMSAGDEQRFRRATP